jgi:hypothetical protein
VTSYEITVLRADGRVYGTAAADGGLLEMFRSLPGSRLAAGTVGAVEIRHPDGTTEHHDAFHDEPCPACGAPVPLTGDAVWTCPADLSAGNPFRLPPDPRITTGLQDQDGIYSNCGEDFGLPCYERMPLHAACYDTGHY